MREVGQEGHEPIDQLEPQPSNKGTYIQVAPIPKKDEAITGLIQ
jgi:hypothetical protein